MDIPLVGSHASKALKKVYDNDLNKFREAVNAGTDFTAIQDIGETINANIRTWFANEVNCKLWNDLYSLMAFEETASPAPESTSENPFNGLTVVATGKLKNFTRESINSKLIELGASPGDSVTKSTNYVIAGEKAGSKLTKAESLNIPVLTEEQFLEMIGK